MTYSPLASRGTFKHDDLNRHNRVPNNIAQWFNQCDHCTDENIEINLTFWESLL